MRATEDASGTLEKVREVRAVACALNAYPQGGDLINEKDSDSSSKGWLRWNKCWVAVFLLMALAVTFAIASLFGNMTESHVDACALRCTNWPLETFSLPMHSDKRYAVESKEWKPTQGGNGTDLAPMSKMKEERVHVCVVVNTCSFERYVVSHIHESAAYFDACLVCVLIAAIGKRLLATCNVRGTERLTSIGSRKALRIWPLCVVALATLLSSSTALYCEIDLSVFGADRNNPGAIAQCSDGCDSCTFFLFNAVFERSTVVCLSEVSCFVQVTGYFASLYYTTIDGREASALTVLTSDAWVPWTGVTFLAPTNRGNFLFEASNTRQALDVSRFYAVNSGVVDIVVYGYQSHGLDVYASTAEELNIFLGPNIRSASTHSSHIECPSAGKCVWKSFVGLSFGTLPINILAFPDTDLRLLCDDNAESCEGLVLFCHGTADICEMEFDDEWQCDGTFNSSECFANVTTMKPTTTTLKPSTTTLKPSTTTLKPTTTTRKPSTTTLKPSTTTLKPTTTTRKPSTTTLKPTTTSLKPTTTTRKPSTTTLKPSTTTLKPSTTTLKPSTTTLKPSTTTLVFTCFDGCEITPTYFDDDWCDCTQCEDEPNWSCVSCGFCPRRCGSYVRCIGGATTHVPLTTTLRLQSTAVSESKSQSNDVLVVGLVLAAVAVFCLAAAFYYYKNYFVAKGNGAAKQKPVEKCVEFAETLSAEEIVAKHSSEIGGESVECCEKQPVVEEKTVSVAVLGADNDVALETVAISVDTVERLKVVGEMAGVAFNGVGDTEASGSQKDAKLPLIEATGATVELELALCSEARVGTEVTEHCDEFQSAVDLMDPRMFEKI